MLNSIRKGIFLFSFKLSERGRVVVLVSYGNNSFGSFPYGTNFDSTEAARRRWISTGVMGQV